jgi:hypothetical protein
MSFRSEIERLTRLRPVVNPSRDGEVTRCLFLDYLERASGFLTAIGGDSPRPLFSAVNQLRPEDPSQELEVDALLGEDWMQNTYYRGIAKQHLLLHMLAERGHPVAKQHVDMYEPLIKIIEAGGLIQLHHGDTIIDGAAFPWASWQKRLSKQRGE